MQANGFLQEILRHKRQEVRRARRRCPEAELRARLPQAPTPRSLQRAIEQRAGCAVIAELKKASPSAGVLRSDFQPARLAAEYQSHGATAVSVLTDEHYFQGSNDHLRAVRPLLHIPILRKDFIVDPYQVLESRVLGADAILLIVAALEAPALGRLLACAHALQLEALVEVHTLAELETALTAGATLIGVNNRDLGTFGVDLGVTERLAPHVPPGVTLIAESGIHCAADARRLLRAGASALLIGTRFMARNDPGRALAQLLDEVERCCA